MSNAEYSGKVATKTFKQIAQERLLKATVIPASELAKQKQEELERANAFTRAALDEEFVNRSEKSVSTNCPTPIGQRVGRVISREPYVDLTAIIPAN
jgi:hypothetical protein